MAKENFYSRGGKGKSESQPTYDTTIQYKSETKNARPSIDFVETPYQQKVSIGAKLNQVQEELVSQEVKELLAKGTIRETIHCKDQYVSNLFLVSKKGGGQRPVINWKELNTFIPSNISRWKESIY